MGSLEEIISFYKNKFPDMDVSVRFHYGGSPSYVNNGEDSRAKLKKRHRMGNTEHGEIILVDENEEFVILSGYMGAERYARYNDFPDYPEEGDWCEYETVYGEPRDRAVNIEFINHMVG
jgi:hypothetical protein